MPRLPGRKKKMSPLIDRYKKTQRLNSLVSDFQRIVFDFGNGDIGNQEFIKKLKSIYIATIKEFRK